MVVERGNLRLRNAEINDVAYLLKWWNDGEIMEHAGFPNGLGISQEMIIEEISTDNDDHRRLIIELENIPIGEMAYHTPADGVARIGIKICDFTKREKGHGTVLLRMLMEYLFFKMKYEKIILDTNMNNKRAQHVYENKIGFRKVCVNINSWMNQVGEIQSSVDYEMLRENYKINQ